MCFEVLGSVVGWSEKGNGYSESEVEPWWFVHEVDLFGFEWLGGLCSIMLITTLLISPLRRCEVVKLPIFTLQFHTLSLVPAPEENKRSGTLSLLDPVLLLQLSGLQT